jgi:hypothetical protein
MGVSLQVRVMALESDRATVTQTVLRVFGFFPFRMGVSPQRHIFTVLDSDLDMHQEKCQLIDLF